MNAAVSLALFSATLSVYLLTFSGRFSSIDELALYAMTESVAQNASLARPMLSFAQFHNPVGRIEPLYSLVAAPLYWLGTHLQAVSTIHLAMLLNPLLTALTAVGIFLALRSLRYSYSASVLPAVAFAFTTLAFPYTRSFLREPLVAFLWVAALLCLIAWRRLRRRRWLVAAGLILLLSALTKLTAAVGIIALGLVVLFAGERWRRNRLRMSLVGLTVVVFSAILIIALGANRRGSVFWFVPVVLGVRPLDVLVNLYGYLLSPGKGLFLYAPVLLASFFGVRGFLRRNRVEAWAVFALVLGMLAVCAIYPQKFAGQIWGPRYILPALPFMVMPLAEVVEAAAAWVRSLALGLGAVSLVAQLPAVVGDWLAYRLTLLEVDPNPEVGIGLNPLRFDLSPVRLQFSQWRADNLNLLWLHRTQVDGAWLFDRPLGALLIAAVVLCAVILVLILVSRRRGFRFPTLPAAALSVLIVAAAGAMLMASGPGDEPGYYGLAPAEARAIGANASDSNGPYWLALVSNEFGTYPLLGYLKGSFETHWVSPSQEDGFDEFLSPDIPQRLTLVIDHVHATADESIYALASWLSGKYYRYWMQWIGGYEVWSYTAPGPGLVEQSVPKAIWADAIRLESLAVDAAPWRPGQPARIECEFRALAPAAQDYSIFLHLVSPAGAVYPGQDAPPEQGVAPTSHWQTGDLVNDKRAFWLPEDLPPGNYTLVMGFVAPDGARLPLQIAGADATDKLTLATVQVTAP